MLYKKDIIENRDLVGKRVDLSLKAHISLRLKITKSRISELGKLYH